MGYGENNDGDFLSGVHPCINASKLVFFAKVY